jgi:hypothetical protein
VFHALTIVRKENFQRRQDGNNINWFLFSNIKLCLLNNNNRMVATPGITTLKNVRNLQQTQGNNTPNSKMAAASDDLGRVARERGIEGHNSNVYIW